MKLVIDTNILLQSLSRKNPYNVILQSVRISTPHYLLISNEIMSEYYELLSRNYSSAVFKKLSLFIEKSIKIITVEPHYRFNLISVDPDDNKFIDCAICGNADFLITSDGHFEEAKKVKFPEVNIISPEDFIKKYL